MRPVVTFEISIIDVDIDSVRDVYEWVKENITPTYKDHELEEHLYSIDDWDGHLSLTVPDNVKEMFMALKREWSNAGYVRFVNY